jgi:DNA-binding SARP family transcriptional activator
VLTDLEFRLLGPLTVLAGGEPVPIGGPRQQVVLAVLILEANRVVPVERLVEAVWADEPPTTARSQIQMAVSGLRRGLAKHTDAKPIVRHPAGYSLEVSDDAIDVARFERAIAAARDAIRQGALETGAVEFRRALGVWSGGDAAAGLELSRRVLHAAAVRLNEKRLTVLEECLDVELKLGRHHDVIAELRELVESYPLREGFHAHLMLALYRAGRQAEALEAYRTAHRVLADEHGLDPGEHLVALERAILTNDPSLARPDGTAATSTPAAHPVPRQLPAAVPDFVGRDDLVADLSRTLTRTGASSTGGVEVIVISGAGGVGKTTFAVHVAHGLRDSFPDGQLFARLRGVNAQPIRPKQILEEFLRSLGVSPSSLPQSVTELAAEFRSRLAGSRTLIVLDEAVSVEQVTPLLPGGPGCAVLLTSRRPLHGLPGARRIDLDVLAPDASLALLARVVGADRVEKERQAAQRLAEACSHLPLALRIAAAKLSVRRHWSIERMLDRLSDERRRLDELALEGVGVRASIAFSYQLLSDEGRRLLLLLSLLGATDFGDWVAAPLLDADVESATDIIQELDEASLVIVESAEQQPRYRLHDLIRIFANEQLAKEVAGQARVDAQNRLLRCWLYIARQAHVHAHGGDFTVLHSNRPQWTLPDHVVDRLVVDPIEWFATEHANLVTAVELAAQLDYTDICWDLAMTSATLFEARAYTDSWRQTHAVALDACRRAGDRHGEAVMWYSSGELSLFEDRLAEAEDKYERALSYFTEVGQALGRGLATRGLALIAHMQGQVNESLQRYETALDDLQVANDRFAQAHVLSGMAHVYIDRGEFDHAARLLEQGLEISTEIGASRAEAQVRNRLGHLYLAEERLDEAEAAFTAVLAAVTRHGDPVGQTYAHLGIGLVRLARGDWLGADQVLQQARAVAETTGDQLSLGRLLLAMADASRQAGDNELTALRLAEARSVFAAAEAHLWLERTADLARQVEGDRQRVN